MKQITAILVTTTTLIALTACGDNLLADIDNSTTTSTTTTTTSTANNEASIDSNTSNIVDNNSTLEVPTFPANSMGRMVVQCEEDIAYFIMAYNCLKTDTRVDATVDNGTVVIDNRSTTAGTNGTIYYVEGHVERTEPITITGTVYSGGVDLPTSTDWVARCD